MMKRILIIMVMLIGTLYSSCKLTEESKANRLYKKNTKHIKDKYSYLGVNVEFYFYKHYSYPKNLDDFLAFFANHSDFKTDRESEKTYNKLKRNRKKLYSVETDSHYMIFEKNKKPILKLNKKNICDLLNDDRFDSFLMNNIIFFKNRQLLLNENTSGYENIENMRKRLSFLRHNNLSFQAHDWELIHYTKDTIVYDCGKMDVTKPHPDTARMKDTLAVLMQEYKADSLVLVIPVAPLEKIKEN